MTVEQRSFGSSPPRVSVITVWNRRDALERCILPSLALQDGIAFEWLGIDNRDGAFASAAAALNAAAVQARGEVLLFAHQDVVLWGRRWLAELHAAFESLPDAGVAGVVGAAAADGAITGFMQDRNAVAGQPLPGPLEVQTLDECVLAMRAGVYRQQPFDESLEGWHVYGVDACLRVRRAGLRVYVLPLFIHHDSGAANLAGLGAAHARIYRRHGGRERVIFTTCGAVRHRHALVDRVIGAGRRRTRALRGLGSGPNYLSHLDALGRSADPVLVLHFQSGPRQPCVPVAFTTPALVPQSRDARQVEHRLLLEGSAVGQVVADALTGQPELVLLMDLDAAPGEELGQALSALRQARSRVCGVYRAPAAARVEAMLVRCGWSPGRTTATWPFVGPGPVRVTELVPG